MSIEPAKGELRKYDTANSPFLELKTPFTKREALKMLLLIWLVPLRLALGVSAVLVLACMSYVAAYNQDISKPLKPWRRKVVEAGSKCAGVILVALGFRVKVRGLSNFKKARQLGALGVFNHSSWVDSILMMYFFAPSGVSLASNADLPVVGTCIRAFQNIDVPRTSHGTAKKNALNGPVSNGPKPPSVSDLIAKRAKDRRFPMLIAAPEGTCGDGRCILHFRSGCFLPGVPLLPILLKYEKQCHNPAWTIINEGWHFLRLVCQFYNSVEVTILPPYVPTEQEIADPRRFANNVRQIFSKTLQLPMVDQTVAQYAALTRAGVTVSLDGRRIVAPPGIVDANGLADLSKWA